MRFAKISISFLLASATLAAPPSLALESQALGWVEPLPAQISQVFACGTWSVAQRSGYYRVVLAEVNEGAGTEVYIQRIQETVEGSSRSIRVLATVEPDQRVLQKTGAGVSKASR